MEAKDKELGLQGQYIDTKVIILDEATSALDINTEKILENIKNFGNNKSMIMITHRINTGEFSSYL